MQFTFVRTLMTNLRVLDIIDTKVNPDTCGQANPIRIRYINFKGLYVYPMFSVRTSFLSFINLLFFLHWTCFHEKEYILENAKKIANHKVFIYATLEYKKNILKIKFLNDFRAMQIEIFLGHWFLFHIKIH